MNMSYVNRVYQFGVVCYFCLNAERLLLLRPCLVSLLQWHPLLGLLVPTASPCA